MRFSKVKRRSTRFEITEYAILFRVTIAAGIHLFPFRTEKLSLPAPMVLRGRLRGRVGRRPFFIAEGLVSISSLGVVLDQGIGLGAFAVIFNERGEVLLCLRRDLPLWNLPGGGVEPGESPREAVVREVREEVCLDVEVERLAGVYWKPESPELVFSLEGLPENCSAKQVERVRDILESPEETIMKTQRGLSSRERIERGL
jgi:hypothetical protein